MICFSIFSPPAVVSECARLRFYRQVMKMKTKDFIHSLSMSNPHIEFATDHSRIYDEFVPSLMHRDDLEVSHPQEYNGQIR